MSREDLGDVCEFERLFDAANDFGPYRTPPGRMRKVKQAAKQLDRYMEDLERARHLALTVAVSKPCTRHS
jgi:hypothetical protein